MLVLLIYVSVLCRLMLSIEWLVLNMFVLMVVCVWFGVVLMFVWIDGDWFVVL